MFGRRACRNMWGICGDMRDGPPPRNQPGRAAVFGPAPPNPRRTGNRNGKRSASRKKNAYFVFNLLIVNNINQYFNMHLHLIRFITYNSRIFIAQYLFENKTCIIFAYVKNNINKPAYQKPIQVPRVRANLMTNKELNKVQNEVKKASEKTLTGAVKAWCQLFKSGKEVNEILKENEIKVDKSIVPALVNLAKDKEVVIQLCKEILPRINNTFCAYKEVEREYYDKNDQDKNKKLKMNEIEDIAILGSSHKRFGYNEPIEFDFGIYYETFNGTDKRIVKCAVPIKRYTFSLIAKCVTYYLTHPKNDR